MRAGEGKPSSVALAKERDSRSRSHFGSSREWFETRALRDPQGSNPAPEREICAQPSPSCTAALRVFLFIALSREFGDFTPVR